MKIYSEPMTKVVNVNVKAICEISVDPASKDEGEDPGTEAPLF